MIFLLNQMSNFHKKIHQVGIAGSAQLICSSSSATTGGAHASEGEPPPTGWGPLPATITEGGPPPAAETHVPPADAASEGAVTQGTGAGGAPVTSGTPQSSAKDCFCAFEETPFTPFYSRAHVFNTGIFGC